MLLIGDLGGTKVNLALFSVENGRLKLEQEATFKSANHNSLEAVALKFLADTDVKISKAVFGVAGPVINGQAHITNLPWQMTEPLLTQALGNVPVKLLNDLESVAYAVPYLPNHELAALNGDTLERRLSGNKAIVAPGTGLGEALLIYNNGSYHPVPCEGGHASFAPTNPIQIGLLEYLLHRFNHVSYERVCSGSMGIPNIYAYLSEVRSSQVQPHITAAIEAADDVAPVIVQAALSGECELCLATLNTFVSILGNEAGNIALKVMATGGIYLGGGIPPKILPKLKEGGFMAAFVNKGRFGDMLSHIPVYVILNDKAALWGAANYGLHHM